MNSGCSVLLIGESSPKHLARLLRAAGTATFEFGRLSCEGGRTVVELSVNARTVDSRELEILQDRAQAIGFTVLAPVQAHASPTAPPTQVLTVLAERIRVEPIADLCEALDALGARILSSRPLATEPLAAHEFSLASPAPLTSAALRDAVRPIENAYSIDIAIHDDPGLLRGKRLVIFDMDSTLVEQEVIDEMARYVGAYSEVASVTERAMCGELSFDEALRARCRSLAGAPESVFDWVRERLVLTPDVPRVIRVLKRLGFRIAVVSGGFLRVVEPVQRELGLDHAFANRLEVREGRLTGTVDGPIVNRERKAEILGELSRLYGIAESQVVAVGDGANDLLMLARAGMGIAYRAKPAVASQARYQIRQRSMLPLLFLLGLSASDIESLDR